MFLVRSVVVQGDGIEPSTPTSSGWRSTTELPSLSCLVVLLDFPFFRIWLSPFGRLRRVPATGWARDGRRRPAIFMKQALASWTHGSMRPISGHRRTLPGRIFASVGAPHLRLSRDCNVKERPRSGSGASPLAEHSGSRLGSFAAGLFGYVRIRSDLAALSSLEGVRSRTKTPFWRYSGSRWMRTDLACLSGLCVAGAEDDALTLQPEQS